MKLMLIREPYFNEAYVRQREIHNSIIIIQN